MNKQDIEKILQNDNQSVIIAELQNGRDSVLPNAEHFIKQLEPEKHDVMDRALRRDKWVSITSDDTLTAEDDVDTKTITSALGDRTTKRREPVARVAIAIQKLIVKRAIAFLFGKEPTLNCETDKSNKAENLLLTAIKRVQYDNKINTINRRVARSTFSTTEAAEYWYTVADEENEKYGFKSKYKLRCAVFSPLKGDTLYPYFDENGDMIAFSREWTTEDSQKTLHYHFEMYTDSEYRLWNKDSGEWAIEKRSTNPIGKIPVIYAHQMETEWADVQGLIDRLEKLLSNFADTNDYHAAPKIFVTGNITGWAKKGESGAVIEGEDGAKAEYLSWSQAPEAVKLEIETLINMIYTITQTPDISWDSVKGMNVSGVALKFLFMDAHLKVQEHSEVFGEYLQRRINVLKAYLKKMNVTDKAFTTACDTLLIEPEIVPYMINDESQEVQTLMAATGNKAILSRKTAVQQLGWVNDAEEEMKQIDAEEEKQNTADIAEPTM